MGDPLYHMVPHSDDGMMHQVAPFPHGLEELVAGLKARPGYLFNLIDQVQVDESTRGLYFVVRMQGTNSYHPERGNTYPVYHYFTVPAVKYKKESWLQWLFDCLRKVDDHELAEWFRINEIRPFAPIHDDLSLDHHDPYIVRITSDWIEKIYHVA